jgi:hypothetical protein
MTIKAKDIKKGDVIHLGLNYSVKASEVYAYPDQQKVVVIMDTGCMLRLHIDDYVEIENAPE